jgi:hypothetical protein
MVRHLKNCSVSFSANTKPGIFSHSLSDKRYNMLEPTAAENQSPAQQRETLRKALLTQSDDFERKCSQITKFAEEPSPSPADDADIRACHAILSQPEMALHKSEMVRAASALKSAVFQDDQLSKESAIVNKQLTAKPENETLWAERKRQLETKDLPDSQARVEAAQDIYGKALDQLEQTMRPLKSSLPRAFQSMHDDIEWAAQQAKTFNQPLGAPGPLDDPALTSEQREMLTLQTKRPAERTKAERSRLTELRTELEPQPDSTPALRR